MKKYLLAGLCLTVLLCNGCKKEQEVYQEPNEFSLDEDKLRSNQIDSIRFPGVSIENDVLCFSSAIYYDSIVSNESTLYSVEALMSAIDSSDFISYGKIHGQDSEFDEPFMEAILNRDRVVAIGDWLILIDYNHEEVRTIRRDEDQAYACLLAGNGNSMRRFSTGDDVLDHLVNNTMPDERSCGGIGGGIYPAYTNSSNAQIIGNIGGTDIRLNTGVKFFKAGIYFRLSSLYELWPNISGLNGIFNINVQVKGPEGWRMRKPCSSGTTGTIAANTITINSSSASAYSTFYSGTHNLNGYYFFVRAICTNCGTGWTPYGGRNINSPY